MTDSRVAGIFYRTVRVNWGKTMEPAKIVQHAGADSGELIFLDPRARALGGSHRPSPAIRVLLADGEGLVRAGFRALLEGESDISVAGEAATGEEAVELTAQMRPDVILMDSRLPGLDGIEATRRILTNGDLAQVNVLILTASETDENVFGALRAGARGFLAKDTNPVNLVRAVRVVADGAAQLSPKVTRQLVDEFVAAPDPQRPLPEQLEELTAREGEVMTLAAMGLNNGEIAKHLVISTATAKTHVSRAMMKLHARDRANLVALAYQTGLVQPRSTSATPRPDAPPSGHLVATA
jgi:DNA-binding NarL/FixJ family response regulator